VAVGIDGDRGEYPSIRRHPNTSAVFLDVPDELKGKINVVPEMNDIVAWRSCMSAASPVPKIPRC
jgi:hypothetical protein